MGFFKKLFRGVKKVFKKVGKGIKKVVGKVGKFMNKIGIVGQIAMSFLLPGIGGLIGKAAGAMMASSNAVIAGAGNFLNAAVNIATKAGSMVKSVGDGVMKVVGQTVGTAINKIPGAGNFIKGFTKGAVDITQMKNFTGPGGIMDTVSKSITDVAAKGGDLFSMSTLKDPNKFIGPETLDKLGKTKVEFEKTDVDITAEDESVLQRMEEGTTERKSLLERDPVSGTVSPTTENFQKMYDENAGGFRSVVDANPEQYPGVVRTSELPAGGGVMQLDASGKPQGLDPTIQPQTFGSRVRSALNPENVGRAVRDTFGTDFQQDTTPYGSQFDMTIPQQEEYQLYAYGAQRFKRSQNQMTTVQYFTGVNEQAA